MSQQQDDVSRPLADQQAKMAPDADATEHAEPTDQSATLASGGDARTGKSHRLYNHSPSLHSCN